MSMLQGNKKPIEIVKLLIVGLGTEEYVILPFGGVPCFDDLKYCLMDMIDEMEFSQACMEVIQRLRISSWCV